MGAPREQSGFLAALEAGLTAYGRHLETKAEVSQREEAMGRAEALKYVRITDVRTANMQDGRVGVFATVENGSNTLMTRVVVEFQYVDAEGTILYKELATITDLASSDSIQCGVYLRQVAGYKVIQAIISDIDY